MAFKDFILGALTGAAEQLEEVSIEAGLDSLAQSDREAWAETCAAGQLLVARLSPHVKGKFPAAMVEGLGIAIKQSQDANPDPAQTSDTGAGGQ